MTTKDLVTALSQEVQKNPVFKDFALHCVTRQRARKELTLTSVSRNMKAEGFDYSDAQLIQVLKTLSELDIGKLDRDHKGRIRGLKDIRLTLQSLGAAALGQENPNLKPFKGRAAFGVIAKEAVPTPTAPYTGEDRRRAPRPWQTSGAKVVLTVLLGEKPINIPMPSNLTPEEIAALVQKFSKGE